MKKLLLFALLMIAVASASVANSSSMFKIDEQKISSEMAAINEIEVIVNSQNLTLSDLLAENNSLATSSLLPAYGAASIASLSDGPPLGIPSFAWGFCLNWVGIVLVYVITQDQSQTKKALWGCVLGSVLYTVFYVVVYAAAWSTV